MAFQNNYKKYLDRMHQTDNENLTEKEMKELQEAIDNSNMSADLEENQRQLNQAAEVQKRVYKTSTNSPGPSEKFPKEKSFTPKQWSKQAKSPTHAVEKEPLHKDFKITFQDFLEASSKSLDIVYHPTAFNLPVTTNPLYQKYNVQTRAKLLFNDYTKVHKLRAKIARRSIYMAPYPKPILSSNKSTDSLLKNEEDNNGNFDFLADAPQSPELYVSRAGRHIKRKIYTEEVEVDSDPDLLYPSKKNKADILDNSDLKITLDNPYIPEEKSSTPAAKTKKVVQKPFTLNARKALNRSEEMFDTLVHTEEKKKKQEEEIESFKKSLTSFSDDENVLDNSPVKESEDQSDENFVKRRVVPPKRLGRARRTTKQEDKEKNESPPGSPVLKRQANPAKTRANKQKPKGPQKSRGQEEATSSVQKTTCPICNKEFSNSEIVDHAAGCGLDDSLQPTVGTSRSAKPIKCEICEKNFPRSMYEDHVKKCVAAKITDS